MKTLEINLDVKNTHVIDIVEGRSPYNNDKEVMSICQEIVEKKRISDFNKFRFLDKYANYSFADLADTIRNFPFFCNL